MFVVDRVKELIKYKGYQVAPAELEAVLLTHAGRRRRRGHRRVRRARATRCRRRSSSGRRAARATEDDVLAYVAERTAPYKRVRQVEFIDAVPKAARQDPAPRAAGPRGRRD